MLLCELYVSLYFAHVGLLSCPHHISFLAIAAKSTTYYMPTLVRSVPPYSALRRY